MDSEYIHQNTITFPLLYLKHKFTLLIAIFFTKFTPRIALFFYKIYLTYSIFFTKFTPFVGLY